MVYAAHAGAVGCYGLVSGVRDLPLPDPCIQLNRASIAAWHTHYQGARPRSDALSFSRTPSAQAKACGARKLERERANAVGDCVLNMEAREVRLHCRAHMADDEPQASCSLCEIPGAFTIASEEYKSDY